MHVDQALVATVVCLLALLHRPCIVDAARVFTCTFDGANNPMCGLTNDTNGVFTWTRRAGSTPSEGTGPSYGHQSGNRIPDLTNQYVYIEASPPRKPGDNARLISPRLSGSGPYCLTLWTHLRGHHLGFLNIYEITANGERKLWGTTEHMRTGSIEWEQKYVTLSSNAQQFVIEGIRGGFGMSQGGAQGDIGVDDIAVDTGACDTNTASTVTPSTIISRAPTTSKPSPATPSGGGTELLSCNFEFDLCKFTQDVSDKFDWTRNKGPTASSGTGPSVDHTSGNSQGYYLYTESSSPRKKGDTARLLSPSVKASGPMCLMFWYHAFGNHIGALNIYEQRPNGRIWIWTENGGADAVKDNVWKKVSLELTRDATSFIVEGVRGDAQQGDIAVDDFRVVTGACAGGNMNMIELSGGSTVPPITRPTPSKVFECDFEDNNRPICSITQNTDDQFQWTRSSGSTQTDNTGPSGDHTKSDGSGYYMYIEVSSITKRGDAAVLTSPSFNQAEVMCLTFWYYAYGDQVGALNVYEQRQSRKIWMWTQQGQAGNRWHRVAVAVSPLARYIIFEGVRGTGARGDIAIDDISLDVGICTGDIMNMPELVTKVPPFLNTITTTKPPPVIGDTFMCDFEDDSNRMCVFSQDQTDKFNWTRKSGNTPSDDTGPATDHTRGAVTGHYLHIEASSPRLNGDEARLVSKQFIPSSDLCMRLWYNAYGAHIGALNIYERQQNGQIWIWTGQGSQPSDQIWREIVLDITQNARSIVIEGVVGAGQQGDIAIDDVSLSRGSCGSGSMNMAGLGQTTTTSLPVTTPSTSVDFSCNFEDTKATFCVFTQDTNDNFDWKYLAGPTQSSGTGPDVDHTLNSRQGHYLYIEASTPRRDGEKARLVSRTLSPAGVMCLRFWLHAHGLHVGALIVYERRAGQGNSLSDKPIWKMEGQSDTKWSEVILEFTQDTRNIVIEGVVGPGYQGDIAIDDVLLESKSCGNNKMNIGFSTARPPPTTQSPTTAAPNPQLIFTCNFDNPQKPLCDLQQDSSDTFNWTRHSGETLTKRTGPMYDHTLKNANGYYLYTEASDPRKQGDIARLISQRITTRQPSCFRFWNNMNGGGLGALNVYERQAQNSGKWIWTRNDNVLLNNAWQEVVLDMTSDMEYIVIEGIRGGTVESDIAIDDLSLTAGACPSGAMNMIGLTTVTPRATTTAEITTPAATTPAVTTPAPTTTITTTVTTPSSTPAATTPTNPNQVLIFKCDFESTCTLQQDTSDVFDWTRKKGNTPSKNTGPQNDHTLQNGDGYYLYTEASNPRKLGDTARLISQKISGTGPSCFRFWYNMNGGGLGTLNVYERQGPKSDLWIWTKNDDILFNQPWREVTLDITSRAENIVIEGVRGGSMESDIAIDDVSLYAGACANGAMNMNGLSTTTVKSVVTLPKVTTPSATTPTVTTPSVTTPRVTTPSVTTPSVTTPAVNRTALFRCDFEDTSAPICGLDLDTNASMNWTRQSGNTPTAGTGPMYDHTFGPTSKKGYYLYTEVTSQSEGDTATFSTKAFQTTGSACVVFWYYFYGLNVGTMKVTLVDGNNAKQVVWDSAGRDWRIEAWQRARVDITPSSAGWRIQFDGVAGKGDLGDVAIDDVLILNGRCDDRDVIIGNTPGPINLMSNVKSVAILLTGHPLVDGTLQLMTITTTDARTPIRMQIWRPEAARKKRDTNTAAASNYMLVYQMRYVPVKKGTVEIRPQSTFVVRDGDVMGFVNEGEDNVIRYSYSPSSKSADTVLRRFPKGQFPQPQKTYSFSQSYSGYRFEMAAKIDTGFAPVSKEYDRIAIVGNAYGGTEELVSAKDNYVMFDHRLPAGVVIAFKFYSPVAGRSVWLRLWRPVTNVTFRLIWQQEYTPAIMGNHTVHIDHPPRVAFGDRVGFGNTDSNSSIGCQEVNTTYGSLTMTSSDQYPDALSLDKIYTISETENRYMFSLAAIVAVDPVDTMNLGQSTGLTGGQIAGLVCGLLAAIIIIATIIALFIIAFHERQRKSFKRRGSLEVFGVFQDETSQQYFGKATYLSQFFVKSYDAPFDVRNEKEWEFPRDLIQFGDIICENDCGIVVSAQAKELDGNMGWSPVSVRTLKDTASDMEKQNLLRELELLKMLRGHPNVLQLLGYCLDKDPLLLMYENVPFGNLEDYLHNIRRNKLYLHAGGYADPQVAEELLMFGCHIAQGMSYLSSLKILHRDMAARNILLGNMKVCKITNIGFARDVIESHQYEKNSGSRLPIRWMAPESMYQNIYTSKSDVWSFGVVLWEIVTLGATPYQNMTATQVSKAVKKGYRIEKPAFIKDELYGVMMNCWKTRPDERPSFDRLVKTLEPLMEKGSSVIQLERFPENHFMNLDMNITDERV